MSFSSLGLFQKFAFELLQITGGVHFFLDFGKFIRYLTLDIELLNRYLLGILYSEQYTGILRIQQSTGDYAF
jgi:hypothetical protein